MIYMMCLLTIMFTVLLYYVIIKQFQMNYDKRYRDDGGAVVQFLQGITAAGGTLAPPRDRHSTLLEVGGN